MGIFDWVRTRSTREPGVILDDADQKRNLLVKARDMGHLLFESSDVESPFGMPTTPFTMGTSSDNGLLSEDAWSSSTPTFWSFVGLIGVSRGILRHGSGFQDVLDKCPDDIIPLLRKHAVTKLGTFQITDSDAVQAFGKNTMLTRGSDSAEDPEFERSWKECLQRRLNSQNKLLVGWEEMVTLNAYVVNIKHIASRDQGAFLSLLLQKYSSGTASKKIWEFPAVRAVINYHWEHWAQRFLLLSAIFYTGWVLSFAFYLILYIEFEEEHDGIGDRNSPERAMSYVLNLLSFIFMCPFAIVEYWTLLAQGFRWIEPRNLLDLATILLQVFIFACQSIGTTVNDEWFGAILGLQCVLLLAKLQNFGRVLGAGAASFSEIFFSVMYDVRYLLAYTFLTGFSMALCLGAIYKHDENYQAKRIDFSNTMHSLVTTFEIVFGSFSTAFIFEADYKWFKIPLLIGFQVLMTITVVNLFIAVMTESYSKFMAEQRIRYNRGRAGVIEELESLRIPNLFPEMKPYIHFLTVEKKSETTRRPSLLANVESSEELSKKVQNVNEKLDMVLQLLGCPPADHNHSPGLEGPSTH